MVDTLRRIEDLLEDFYKEMNSNVENIDRELEILRYEVCDLNEKKDEEIELLTSLLEETKEQNKLLLEKQDQLIEVISILCNKES